LVSNIGFSEDVQKCNEARSLIDRIDWPCQILKKYSENNLGCRRNISRGLDWVFNNVESAIILEDDCVPDNTFFPFCEELLQEYRDDHRIISISGNNNHFGKSTTKYSYYFSRYVHIWGWASWRRAWNFFDVEMKLWPEVRDSGWLEDLLQNQRAVKYWSNVFQSTYENKNDSWGYQWMFACWINRGLSITPERNLVSNIGFSEDATHTRSS